MLGRLGDALLRANQVDDAKHYLRQSLEYMPRFVDLQWTESHSIAGLKSPESEDSDAASANA
jgi:hypothetical protein